MQPEIDLGPLTLQTFGICFALAFVASGALMSRRLSELGKPADWAYEAAFAALAGGLVGSRLYWLIQHWETTRHDLIGSLFGGAGLVWYGGLVGGALAVVAWARWRGMLGIPLLDLAAPALALGYAIGRCGCQVSGDGDYGRPWDGPWAMAYPNGVVPTTQRVHPTPIYESLVMGIAAIVLWRLRDRFRPGVLFAIYLVWAGAERFLVEFVRRNAEVFAGLTAAQLESLALLVVGVAWLLVLRARGGWAAAGRRPATA
jgi:phosphatidylglycerol---prolipoprotein diacylglyceryl transferase